VNVVIFRLNLLRTRSNSGRYCLWTSSYFVWVSYRQDQILVGTACERSHISFESLTDKIKFWSVLLVGVVVFPLNLLPTRSNPGRYCLWTSSYFVWRAKIALLKLCCTGLLTCYHPRISECKKYSFSSVVQWNLPKPDPLYTGNLDKRKINFGTELFPM